MLMSSCGKSVRNITSHLVVVLLSCFFVMLVAVFVVVVAVDVAVVDVVAAVVGAVVCGGVGVVVVVVGSPNCRACFNFC